MSRRSCAEVSSDGDVHHVALTSTASAWFTGARLDGVTDANLAHHRPHRPERLAAARERVASLTGTDVDSWHLMRQVHGASVGSIDGGVAPGAEIRDVDILVTTLPDRPLVVLAADCLPIAAAGRTAVGVAHAGWRGVASGAPEALVATLVDLGERADELQVAIGPAIGPCCYAVGADVIDAIESASPGSTATTTGGLPSVDLRGAARAMLRRAGVRVVMDVGSVRDGKAPCTACDTRWFSHRRDPSAGRQAGIVVRSSTPAAS